MTKNRVFAVLLVAIGFVFSAHAHAEGEQHRHDGSSESPQGTPVLPQPDATTPLPAVGNAEDMLKALESMPAHDPGACCSLRRPYSKGDDHGH